jgi:hypothetical protein
LIDGTLGGVWYLDERKAALEAWGRYVEDLVRPGAGNGSVAKFERTTAIVSAVRGGGPIS